MEQCKAGCGGGVAERPTAVRVSAEGQRSRGAGPSSRTPGVHDRDDGRLHDGHTTVTRRLHDGYTTAHYGYSTATRDGSASLHLPSRSGMTKMSLTTCTPCFARSNWTL